MSRRALVIVVVLLLAACDPTVLDRGVVGGQLDTPVRFVDVGAGTPYPLTESWRPGCPVAPEALVAVEFEHWRDDGSLAPGVLIVHRDVADDVAEVVRVLYRDRFPMTSARPVDDFGGDDDRSMAADNTSAFNCRFIAGTSRWSDHAYGRAVDVNPERNPYVRGSRVDPPGGRAWLDRSDERPGMAIEGRSLVTVFDSLGWEWGGRWRNAKDWQHFST